MPNPFKHWRRRSSEEEESSYGSREDLNSSDDKAGPLSLVQNEDSDPDLWRRALKTVQRETKLDFLERLHPDERDTLDWVEEIRAEASNRADDIKHNERSFHLPGGKTCTCRKVYENIATCKWFCLQSAHHSLSQGSRYDLCSCEISQDANKFQIAGDLLVQADPGYATLPWVRLHMPIIR